MQSKLTYCKGYKYQLRENFICQTNIYPTSTLKAPLVTLHSDGLLIIYKYFAWDGCSGPTYDDHTNARACLIHDAGYYLMREGLLDCCWRDTVDQELERLMIEDGAHPLRARLYYLVVKLFAASCALPEGVRKLITLPRII